MTSVLHRPQPLPHLVHPEKHDHLLNNVSYQSEHIQTPAFENAERTSTILGDPTNNIGLHHNDNNDGDAENGTIGVIKRTTVPFLAKRQFSRFLSTPKVTPGEVPYPRQQLHTPSPPPPGGLYGITHSLDPEPETSGSSNQTSYALSQDSALADFFRGSLEVTPLPQFEGTGSETQGYFIGWDNDFRAGSVQAEDEDGREDTGPVGCISETEAGWSRSGVKGLSSYKTWSEFGEGRKEVRGRKLGWGWFTI